MNTYEYKNEANIIQKRKTSKKNILWIGGLKNNIMVQMGMFSQRLSIIFRWWTIMDEIHFTIINNNYENHDEYGWNNE